MRSTPISATKPGQQRGLRSWGEAPSQPIAHRLYIAARNFATATVHVERARVGRDAQINILSDGPLEVQLAGCN